MISFGLSGLWRSPLVCLVLGDLWSVWALAISFGLSRPWRSPLACTGILLASWNTPLRLALYYSFVVVVVVVLFCFGLFRFFVLFICSDIVLTYCGLWLR